MLLLTVKETFLIAGSGLILTPGLGEQASFVKTDSPLQLIFPDQTTAETIVKGIVFEHRHIAIPPEWANRVGPGVEVWTMDKEC